MTIAITVEDIHKDYGSLQVLKGLSLQVFEGETLVILGRSGVGKSVLLRLIMGLEKPDRGRIFVGERCQSELDETELRHYADVGMLFQSSALFDSLNIEENIAFPLTCRRGRERFGALSASEIANRVAESLRLVSLSGIQKKLPSDLSGGMKRRVALARLIVYRPSIVLYDEPTTGLDPVTSMQINQLISTVQAGLKATSIVVTHDLTSALAIADRIALHHEGKIAFIADKAHFLESQEPLVTQFLDPMLHTMQQFTSIPFDRFKSHE